MIISVDEVTHDITPLIILKHTGVFYTAQCGGMECQHPQAEGFVIGIGMFAQDFDDCSFGCQHIHHEPKRQKKLAEAFDAYCRERTKNWRWKIRADFERTHEFMEGWLPVIVDGMFDDFYRTYFDNLRGIIHTGNCD